ncbi:hypothetical protein PMAYCL1PPCAC_00476, partial [Pristionchus mayeri]
TALSSSHLIERATSSTDSSTARIIKIASRVADLGAEEANASMMPAAVLFCITRRRMLRSCATHCS